MIPFRFNRMLRYVSFFLFAGLIAPNYSYAGEFKVFDKIYIREASQPDTVTDNFNVLNPNTDWHMFIINGSLEDDEIEKVSSSTLSLNDIEILHPNSFNQKVQSLDGAVDLLLENFVSTSLKSKPGGQVLVYIVGQDSNLPVVQWLKPSDNDIFDTSSIKTQIQFSDDISGIDPSTITILLDGVEITDSFSIISQPFLEQTFLANLNILEGNHILWAGAHDMAGQSANAVVNFVIDLTPPVITVISPPNNDIISDYQPIVSVSLSDNLSGINIGTASISMDGIDVSVDAVITESSIEYQPLQKLASGQHDVQVNVADLAGNSAQIDSAFFINTPPVWEYVPTGYATADEEYGFDIGGFAHDDDGDTLVFTKIYGPDWINVTTNGRLTGMPLEEDIGDSFVTIEANDGIFGSTIDIEIFVIRALPPWVILYENFKSPVDTFMMSTGNGDGILLLDSISQNLHATFTDDSVLNSRYQLLPLVLTPDDRFLYSFNFDISSSMAGTNIGLYDSNTLDDFILQGNKSNFKGAGISLKNGNVKFQYYAGDGATPQEVNLQTTLKSNELYKVEVEYNKKLVSDTDTVLLLHFDGTPGVRADSSVDSSAGGDNSPHTLISSGNARLDGITKFGPTSLLCSSSFSTQQYVSITPLDDLKGIWDGDGWTIDFWLKIADSRFGYEVLRIEGNNGSLIRVRPLRIPTREGIFYRHSVTMSFSNGNSVSRLLPRVNPNEWHHLALEKYNGNVYMYINGKSVFSFSNSGSPFGELDKLLRIQFITAYAQGWTDEFRISKVSRYEGQNFTLPSEPYIGIPVLRNTFSVRLFRGDDDYLLEEITSDFNDASFNFDAFVIANQIDPITFEETNISIDDIYVAVDDGTNQSPVAYNLELTTPKNIDVEIGLKGTDLNGDEITFVIDESPANGTLGDILDNSVLYTPNQDYFGMDTFTYYAIDATGLISNIATVLIDVDPPFTLDPTLSPTELEQQTLTGTKGRYDSIWINDVLAVEGGSAPIWSHTVGLEEGNNELVIIVKNYSGEEAGGITIDIFSDAFPPEKPIVIDDGVSTKSLDVLHASWSAVDLGVGILEYHYAIGTEGNIDDIVPWTNAELNTDITLSDLSLTLGEIYFISVKAKDGFNRWSEIGTNDGIMVVTPDEHDYIILWQLPVSEIQDVAIDVDHNVYILKVNPPDITLVSSDGTTLDNFPISALSPKSLAIDDQKNIYVTDYGNNRLSKYHDNGFTYEVDTGFGSNGFINNLSGPWGVAINEKNEISVSLAGTNIIQMYDDLGNLIKEFGTGEVAAPRGIAFGGSDLYVTDNASQDVKKYDFSEVLVSGIAPFIDPVDVTIGNDGIFILDNGNNEILKFSETTISIFEDVGQEPDEYEMVMALSDLGLNSPEGLAYDWDLLNEYLYVADKGNNRLVKIRLPTITPLYVWNKMKSALAQQDIDGAILNFHIESRDKYKKIFEVLYDRLPDIAADMGGMTILSIRADTCKGVIERYDDELGIDLSYFIEFVKNDGGHWVIGQF